MKDFYLILGINSNATIDEIKTAYFEKMGFYHPDKWQENPSMRQKAEEHSKQINEAYNVLRDPIKREQYDRQRKYSQNNSEHQAQGEYERQKQEQEARTQAEAERRQREQADAQRRDQEARVRVEAERRQREQAEAQRRQHNARVKTPRGGKPKWMIILVAGLVFFVAYWAMTLTTTPPPPASTPTKTPTKFATATIAVPMFLTVEPTLALASPEEPTAISIVEYVDEKNTKMVLIPAANDLSAFSIDLYEVTYNDYDRCVVDRVCKTPHQSQGPRGGDYPVVNVTWYGAHAYCLWREARLPDFAEWKLAAQGPNSLPNPWGEQSFDCSMAQMPLWCDSSFGHYAAPVGSFLSDRSPYGVYDMLGNAAEWVGNSETYAYVRGGGFGSYSNVPSDPFQWNSFSLTPSGWSNAVGFRCAKSAP
jgi:formylglycine-generating enzyme required for sulfatase activity